MRTEAGPVMLIPPDRKTVEPRGALILSSIHGLRQALFNESAKHVGLVVSCIAAESAELSDLVARSGASKANAAFRHVCFLMDDGSDSGGPRTRLARTNAPFMALLQAVHDTRLCGLDVVVHCDLGVTRSASFACAYMIVCLRLSFVEARERISAVREVHFRIYEGDLKRLAVHSPQVVSLSPSSRPLSHPASRSITPQPGSDPTSPTDVPLNLPCNAVRRIDSNAVGPNIALGGPLFNNDVATHAGDSANAQETLLPSWVPHPTAMTTQNDMDRDELLASLRSASLPNYQMPSQHN